MHSKFSISKHLSDNILKQGDDLLPRLFNFALLYAIRIVQETQVVLELNGANQLLVYVYGANLLGDDISTIKKYIETLFDASK
jgi:hypothetical protein